ncbi:MAG: MFS transporter small subunit [Geodermatophilaceae bacterium]|nr:hypothetical protein [Geodermatophilaceae bacterium]
MPSNTQSDNAKPTGAGRVALSWTIVGIPLAYGIYNIILRTAPLFTGG